MNKTNYDYFKEDFHKKNIPSELYHYTSPRALRGILKSNNLWFSNIYFLNDTSEMKYTYWLILEILPNIKKDLDEDFYKKIVERAEYMTCNTYYEEESEIFARLEYYVLCLSTEKNCLNLWSNYTKTSDKTGYNIAFSYKGLQECVDAKGYEFVSFASVCYDLERQKKMLLETILNFNKKYKNAKNGKDKQVVLWDITDNFKIYSVFLKHPAFSDEKEFRIVIGIRTHSHDENCEFEIQNGIFVPHIEHEMPDPEEESIIKSITISPTCDKDLAVYSVRKLANSTKHYFLPIYTSDIPLRSQSNS
ncbi:MAG: DUF2971 domain-containing protein [Candidatus Gastranaerophilales bacterium]|nr:DUF2971 domain-containing protein [Candidatus Gastranaerophilales bacterium]